MSSLGEIIVIEDDEAITTILNDLFTDAGYSCRTFGDGMVGLRAALEGKHNLAVLDVGLPSISGLDICRQIKAVQPNIPVIILTARGEEADVVSGLEVGADDYIQKPFRPRELLARVRARLREELRRRVADSVSSVVSSQPKEETPSNISIGEIEIDTMRMRVLKRGDIVPLSAREYEVVLLLASNPGKAFTREELLASVWEFSADDYDANVSVFFSRLRKKLEDDHLNPKYLLTLRGIGYRFAEVSELK